MFADTLAPASLQIRAAQLSNGYPRRPKTPRWRSSPVVACERTGALSVGFNRGHTLVPKKTSSIWVDANDCHPSLRTEGIHRLGENLVAGPCPHHPTLVRPLLRS